MCNYERSYEAIEECVYDQNRNAIRTFVKQNDKLIFDNRCVYNDDGILINEEIFELDIWSNEILKNERRIHQLESEFVAIK